MKKFYLILTCLALISLTAFSQQVPRDKVIMEVATGAWCQYCPGAAMGADDLIANGYQVAVIEYHNGDPYATTQSNARISYYNVAGFPTAYFDGGSKVEGGDHTNSMFSYYVPKVNARMAVPSSFTIDVVGTQSCLTDFNAEITVNKVATNNSSNLRLHAVLTESDIVYSWQGMDELNYVCRQMYPNQGGTTISFSGGNTQTVNIQFTLDPTYVFENCELVVFLQDNSTKEIFQGTKMMLTEFQPELNYDATAKQLFNVPKSSCTGTFNPEVNIRNVGAQTMSSVEIVYSVNNGAAQTYNWSGSLDYLAQDTVLLPPISFTGQATNDLVVYTSNPNGNPDECTANDQVTLAVPEAMHTPNTVKLILRTDSNPDQTTWQVTDAMGNVMYSGGPYSSSGQMIQETFDFADEACFTFTIFDSGGDGIASPGFYMLYYGSNTQISQGTDFGYQDQVDFNTADPVGIGEQAGKTGVTVYPNPVQDKATIVVTLEKASNVSYSIYSVTGQKMAQSNETSLDAGQHGLVVDASNWQSGLYLYQVKVGEQTFTGKITVK